MAPEREQHRVFHLSPVTAPRFSLWTWFPAVKRVLCQPASALTDAAEKHHLPSSFTLSNDRKWLKLLPALHRSSKSGRPLHHGNQSLTILFISVFPCGKACFCVFGCALSLCSRKHWATPRLQIPHHHCNYRLRRLCPSRKQCRHLTNLPTRNSCSRIQNGIYWAKASW